MRAVQVRCPSCRANLKVPGTLMTVTCDYCGVESRIQASTGVFQRQPPPARVPIASAPPGLPVAIRRVTAVALVMPVIMVAGVATAVYVAQKQLRGAISYATRTGGGGADGMRWNGLGRPVLGDLDGDGVADPLGLVRYVMDDDALHLAAFRGTDGARLWQGPRLGSYGEMNQGHTALIGDTVVFAAPTGALVALRARDGQPAWTGALPEKPERLCRAKGGAVVIEVADGRWFSLDPASGRLTDHPAVLARHQRDDAACAPLSGDGDDGDPEVAVTDLFHTRLEVRGMNVDESARRRGVAGVIALGYRSPGTPVPMLARLDPHGKATWTIDVPTLDPLASRKTDLVALTAERVCTVYRPGQKPPRLACFALADGARRWETEVAMGSTIVMTALVASEQHVMLSSWGHLQVFDLASGQPRYTIGAL